MTKHDKRENTPEEANGAGLRAESAPRATEDLSPQVISGSFWVLIGFGANAIVNLVRTILLARALPIEAYGAAAAVLVVSRVLGALGTLGLQAAAIQQKEEPTRDLMDTVWTIDRLLLKVASAGALFIFAPQIAEYFGDASLESAIALLALFPLAMAVENNAMIALSRKLDIRRRVQLDLSSALGGALILPAIFFYPDITVVVVSLIVGRLLRSIVSYFIYPVWPRFRLHLPSFRKVFPFGRWVFLQNMLLMSREQIDKILLASILGVSGLGLFELGQRLGAQLISIADQLALKVLFPVFARSQEDRQIGGKRYLITLSVLSAVVIPTAAFLAISADRVTPLLFGEGWEGAIVAAQILAIAAAIRVIGGASHPLIRGFGRSDLELGMNIALVGAIIVAILIFAPRHGVVGAAYAVLIAHAVQLPISFLTTRLYLGVSIRSVLRTLSPATLAAALAASLGLGFSWHLPRDGLLPMLIIAAVFAAAYLGLFLGLARLVDGERFSVILRSLRRARGRRAHR